MSQGRVEHVDIDKARQVLLEADYGTHFLLTYPDMDSWKALYPSAARKYLQDDNSIVLVVPFYQTTQDARQTLAQHIANLEQYEKEGSLAVIDSIKAYFSEIGMMTFIDTLIKHAYATGKSGLTVFADMGSFSHMQSMHKLVEHEISLPTKYNFNLRAFCIYHNGNFNTLESNQKQSVYEHHARNLIISPQ